jgi:hypothetical protein
MRDDVLLVYMSDDDVLLVCGEYWYSTIACTLFILDCQLNVLRISIVYSACSGLLRMNLTMLGTA